MRRILPGLVLFAAMFALSAAVEAREVVEFADGRYLEIRSYVVQGDLIRLNVAPGSFMVIPVVGIDEIRRDRDVVFSSRRAVLPGPSNAQAAPRREYSDRVRSEVAPSVSGLVTAGT